MVTQQLSIRIPVVLLEQLGAIAKENDRSRNYIISKFLKEKIQELTATKESC